MSDVATQLARLTTAADAHQTATDQWLKLMAQMQDLPALGTKEQVEQGENVLVTADVLPDRVWAELPELGTAEQIAVRENVLVCADKLPAHLFDELPDVGTAEQVANGDEVLVTADRLIPVIKANAGVAGDLVLCAGSTPSPGTLECDGSALSRTAYADLFAAIGTTYGAGDGADTFDIPDLRGEFLRGWDHGRGVDPDRVLGAPQSHMIEAHTPPYGYPHSSTYGMSSLPTPGVRPGNNTGHATGGFGGSETRPRNIAVMICIKY
ncbi:phage tail collar domain-containing protein [Roseibium sp. TrichSKD4]|uniref:phage tail protein n=1 Tax=Roseibium sp. TrichSKD4 TaxID=744980 RepID=UPI0001E569CF|nr:phage tail protein [Roseibium sp. TrichSKD4]EFO32514.1 phage tail collar domain-containing protein [Roseibium sp. TrichSKD4]